MSNILKIAGAGAFAAEETDENFNQTVLLLHGDGTNGAQNNTFLDSSTNNFTITRNGNTTQGTFSPFSAPDGRWSNYFDGTGDYLTGPSGAAFDITQGDFTLEAWVYRNSSTDNYVFSQRPAVGASGWEFRINSTGTIQIFYTGGSSLASSGTIPLNAWTHIAAARSGSTCRLFINGSLDASASFSNGTSSTGTTLKIGVDNVLASNFHGYMSNARIVKGTAVYTSGFTPDTEPLTAVSGTSLLTCQSNRFVDNSTNNFAITRNGDVKVTSFSPFAPSAAYDASVNGGSGYFDGSGDYLSGASNAALALPGAFTFECWFYPNSFDQVAGDGDTIFSGLASGALTVGRTSGGVGNLWGIAENLVAWRLTTSTLPTNNTWNHMVAVRDGSNNTALFLNGTRVASGTVTTSFTQNGFSLGSYNGTANTFIDGYLSNVRLVKGTAVYDPTSTTLTVPTAPLTAISNTSLLLNFTNAGIFDNTGKNNLETVGNAQIDTTTKKYGTGALEFDGTGDGLYRPASQDLDFGTGNFTIEWWMYFTSKTGFQTIMSYGYSPSVNTGWLIQTGNGDGKVIFYKQTGGVTIASDGGSTVNTGEWYHMAVVRNSGTTTIYRNGTSVGSGADTNNYGSTTANFYVGGGTSTGFDGGYFNGFIDDLRITKGVARYTTTFTPPTKAFPDL